PSFDGRATQLESLQPRARPRTRRWGVVRPYPRRRERASLPATRAANSHVCRRLQHRRAASSVAGDAARAIRLSAGAPDAVASTARRLSSKTPQVSLVSISRRLSKQVDVLRFSAPVHTVYNPLSYARAPHETYLERYGQGPKEVVLVGMNPGPFGMTQTGVPF